MQQMKSDIKRVVILILLVAIPLFLIWQAKEFNAPVMIYFALGVSVILFFLNQQWLTTYWLGGLLAFVYLWILINDKNAQATLLSPTVAVLILIVLFNIPKLAKVITSS